MGPLAPHQSIKSTRFRLHATSLIARLPSGFGCLTSDKPENDPIRSRESDKNITFASVRAQSYVFCGVRFVAIIVIAPAAQFGPFKNCVSYTAAATASSLGSSCESGKFRGVLTGCEHSLVEASAGRCYPFLERNHRCLEPLERGNEHDANKGHLRSCQRKSETPKTHRVYCGCIERPGFTHELALRSQHRSLVTWDVLDEVG